MILKLKKIKSATVSTFPSSICHEVLGLDAMNVECLFVNSFLNVEFYASFFSFPLLINWSLVLCFLLLVWCHLHIWMLIFLPTILIPSWDLCSPAYRMIFPTYKSITRVTMYTLSCSFPNFKSFSCPVSDSNCQFLTYIQTFRRQVRLSATPIILKISLRLLWSTQ